MTHMGPEFIRRWYNNRFVLGSREHRDLIAGAMERQWWPPEKTRKYQWTRLQRMLQHAWDNVPFYRVRMKGAGLEPGDIRTPEDFARLPILTKEDLKDNFDALVARNADRSELLLNATGGSTGVPTQYYQDKNFLRERFAARVRFLSWVEYRVWESRAKLWGSDFDVKLSVPRTLKGKIFNLLFQETKVFPAFNITEEVLRDRHVGHRSESLPDER